MKLWQTALLVLGVLNLSGCETTHEMGKTLWGSSTKALEEARSHALVKTYEKGYWDCYRAALKVAKQKRYTLFQDDAVRGFMVVMGIPGSVDTTEVGVFFVEQNDQQTRVELSSLSTNAKRILGKALFHGMDIEFGLAKPDQEIIISRTDFSDLGEDFFDQLVQRGLLQPISKDGAILKQDAALMKDDLEKEFPNNHVQLQAVLQKVQDAQQAALAEKIEPKP